MWRKKEKVDFSASHGSYHSVNSTVLYLSDHFSSLMKLLVLSPDLNPIENVWGMMTSNVYNTSIFHGCMGENP